MGLVIQGSWAPHKSDEYVEYRQAHFKNLIHLQLWPGYTGAKHVVDLVGQRLVERGMTRGAQSWVQREAHDQMRRGIHPTSVVVDTKMSTIKPHVLPWLCEGFQDLINANIMQ